MLLLWRDLLSKADITGDRALPPARPFSAKGGSGGCKSRQEKLPESGSQLKADARGAGG